MGNQVQGIHHSDQNFNSTINNITYLKNKGESFIQRESDIFEFKQEMKWRVSLLQCLKKESMKKNRTKKDEIVSDLEDIIKNIKENSFIKSVSVLNSFASTKFEGKNIMKQTFATHLNDEHKSNRVKIEIDQTHWANNGIDSSSTLSSIQSEGSFSSCNAQRKNKQEIKRNLQRILVKEINQQYHPITDIKNAFIMLLKMKYRTKLDEKRPKTKQQRQQLLDDIHDDIDFYCCFVASGCEIYKNWIIQHGGVKESRYNSFIKRIVRKGLFNGSSFSQQIFPLIKEICSKQIVKLIQKLPSQIHVNKFDIKPQLAIEGSFMNSLMTLSNFDITQSPNISMQKLQNIKIQICYDIDQYHKLFGSSKNYKIDGQNLLSIVCFLLCRMKQKMCDIYTQINMLKVLFGDDINSEFDQASYLVTTFFSAFQFLISDEFLNTL